MHIEEMLAEVYKDNLELKTMLREVRSIVADIATQMIESSSEEEAAFAATTSGFVAPEEMSREDIKCKLDDLGVQYNSRCATKTLLMQLKNVMEHKEPAQKEEPVSYEQLREALIEYCTVQGVDAGRALVKNQGVDNAKDLSAEQRIVVYKEINNAE